MRFQVRLALLLAFLIPVGLIGQAASDVKALSSSPAPAAALYSAAYYVSTNGSDSNPGSQAQPWRTIQKAVNTITAGDTVYVRGGQYNGIKDGWVFQQSGTQTQPITFTNYPGEQVVLKFIAAPDYPIFTCNSYVKDHPNWQTPKADYIRIIGTDVTTRFLSNGVQSNKGIVMQGALAAQTHAIGATDCDYWEVAGVDFVEAAAGIYTFKANWGTMVAHSTDRWSVHDNRVYIFYREAGMQFNGDDNRIENNEIYKVTNREDTPYSCVLLNLLGDHNIVKGNRLSRLGSTAECSGILFEWDLADVNTVEQNTITDVTQGIDIQGGDNNTIRNNIIYLSGSPAPFAGGIEIKSYDKNVWTAWPCDEATSASQAHLPANDPAHPDYQYYYNPRNCHSYGNQIYNNTIHGFVQGVRVYPLPAAGTIIRNNALSGWAHASICVYNPANGNCKTLLTDLTADHNAAQGNFGFVSVGSHDFHLASASSLIDAGYNLGALNPNDFEGNLRPQGAVYDIGAYEFFASATISGNAGLPGVVLSYNDGGPKSATSGGSGQYALIVSEGWSGTVTPELPGYRFEPPTRSYVDVGVPQGGQDFTAGGLAQPQPADEAVVCGRPAVGVDLNLTDLTRNANGTLNPSAFTLKLDGADVTSQATTRVSAMVPAARAQILYTPATNLSLDVHIASITFADAGGIATVTWNFTVTATQCAANLQPLSAIATAEMPAEMVERQPLVANATTEVPAQTIERQPLIAIVTAEVPAQPIEMEPLVSGDEPQGNEPPGPVQDEAGASVFADVPVPGKEWMEPWILAFYNSGITTACGADPVIYCPENNVTRAEMTAILLRAMHGAGYIPPAGGPLSEALTSGTESMETWMDEYYPEGMSAGCDRANYCPENNVTRAEMAVLVLRALHGVDYVPPAASGVFTDVPVAGKEWMEPWIIQLQNEGITTGCSDGNYCPEEYVTRAETAVSIGRAYHLYP